jgi:hypothetical protein
MLYNKVGYRSYGVAATSAQLRMRMTDLRSMLVTYLVGSLVVWSGKQRRVVKRGQRKVNKDAD